MQVKKQNTKNKFKIKNQRIVIVRATSASKIQAIKTTICLQFSVFSFRFKKIQEYSYQITDYRLRKY